MNIIIRTDASINIGTGHVKRCLTLADELKQRNENVSFICREEKGNLIELIKQNYTVYKLPPNITPEDDRILTSKIIENHFTEIDWLIIDHYEIDASWECSFRNKVKSIMAIDDLANRTHDCDLLLDQNYTSDENRYKELVPGHCIQLTGSKYALLGPQYSALRKEIKEHDGNIKNIIVSMGGTDPTNETCKVLRALQLLDNDEIIINVVIGLSNPYQNEIKKLASQANNILCHSDPASMAQLMVTADLAIGAGGITTWERCCLGLPTIAISVADNQVYSLEELSKNGYVIYSGRCKEVTEQNLLEDIKFLLRHQEIVRNISLKTETLVDGNGVNRVVNFLSEKPIPVQLRPAKQNDCREVFEWRNHPDIRKYFFDPSHLSWNDHERWFLKAVSSPDIALLIAEKDTDFVGVLRYNFKGKNAYISIHVIPELSGIGIGTQVLKIGNNWIKTTHPKIKKIVAEIIPKNISSLKAFQKSGFKESHSTYILNLI